VGFTDVDMKKAGKYFKPI